MSNDVATTQAEVASHGLMPVQTLNLSLSGGSFLNATSSAGGIISRYTPKLLSGFARALGKDGILFKSIPGSGTNLAQFKNFNLLHPKKIL